MRHVWSAAPATQNDDRCRQSAAPATKTATHLVKTTQKYCALHTQNDFRRVKQVRMSQSVTPATQNDMTTCLESFEKESFAASPIDTARPQENQRLETRHVGASKRAFRARLSPIFILCSFKIDVFLSFLRTSKLATSKSMFPARLPSIFSTSHKMPRLPQNLHLVTTWRHKTRLKCCACHAKSKVLRLPRELELIFWKGRKSIAPATKNDFRHVTKHVWMSRSTTPATRNAATQRWKHPKVTSFAELTIGTAIRPSREWLRTVANGCGHKRNVERTHPQPPDPQSETGTLATHSGKIHPATAKKRKHKCMTFYFNSRGNKLKKHKTKQNMYVTVDSTSMHGLLRQVSAFMLWQKISGTSELMRSRLYLTPIRTPCSLVCAVHEFVLKQILVEASLPALWPQGKWVTAIWAKTSRRCRNSSLHPALLVLVLMSVWKVHLYSQSTACQLAVEAFSFSSAVAACNTVYVGSTQFDRALASLQIKLENQYWVCSSLDSMRWKLPAMRKKDSRAIKSQALLHPGGLPGCTARSTLHGSSQQKLELDAFCQKNFLTKLLFSPAFHIMISLCIFDKNVQQQDPMCNCLPLMNVICYSGITHTRKESRPFPKISKPGRAFFDRGRPPSSWTVGLEMWNHEDSFVLKSTRFLETANSTPIWLRSWRSEKHTRRCNKRGMLHEATHLHLAKSRRPMLEPRLSHFQFIDLNTTCCWVAEDDNWVLTDDGVHKVAKSPAIVSWASLETKLH